MFRHYEERVSGEVIRLTQPELRGPLLPGDAVLEQHGSWEKTHIVNALLFELGHVERRYIKEKVVERLANVDGDLATQVADGLGITAPSQTVTNHGRSSPALSMADQPRSIATRKIAVLA